MSKFHTQVFRKYNFGKYLEFSEKKNDLQIIFFKIDKKNAKTFPKFIFLETFALDVTKKYVFKENFIEIIYF